MRASDLLGSAVAVAMALALTALQPVTTDRGLFVDCLVLIAAVGVGGILTRRLLRGDLRAGVVQAAIAALVMAGLAVGAGLSSPFALSRVLANGLDWAAMSTAPMAPNLGVRLITTCAIGLLAYLADQLAVTHHQVAWTLLPLSVPYLLAALTLPGLVPFGALLWLAAGYLLVLLADTAGRLPRLAAASRWTAPGLLAGGLACLLVAAPVAALAGVATPGLDPERGTPFSGRGPVQMGDPSLDLRRNLQEPVDQRILSYRTSTGAGVRLRLTSLPVFDATGFHLDPIDLFDGGLPSPPGVTSGRPRFDIGVSIGPFNSEWLPLPYAPATFDADGDWRHDPLSLSVLAVGDQRSSATNGLHYSATVIDVSPTAEQVAAARAGQPADGTVTGALPDDLPPRIRTLAHEITRNGSTDGEKAVLLQNWLRSSAFSYSLEPAPGSGYDAMTRFLFDDRRGYCEQFATSMAVLARAVGIPSRVAIGFLPGSRTGISWDVSVRNMHAWPELYFAGLGWVGFEPTPAVAQPPDYATGIPTSRPSQSATPTPSVEPSDELKPSTEPEAPEQEPESADPAAATGPGWPVWAGGVLAVGLLVAGPSLVRRARRTRRLAAQPARAAVAGAWDEVRDSVWDAGREWPSGSARQIGAALAAELPADAAAALGRVALLVERARYAEGLGEVGGLGADVATVRDGLAAGAAGPRGLGRKILPRSLWRRLWWRG